MVKNKNNAAGSQELPSTTATAWSFLASMDQGKIAKTPFAYQVAHYVIDYPEKAAELAEHHYQDYLGHKQKYMVRAVVEGRHINRLSRRHAIAKSTLTARKTIGRPTRP